MNQWVYNFEGAEYGPMSEAEILSRVQSGQIPPNTLVSEAGMMNWRPANQVGCFQAGASGGHGSPPTTMPPDMSGAGPGQPVPGYPPGAAAMPPGSATGGKGKEIALGVGGVVVIGVVLWLAYGFFFGSLSPEGLGEAAFDALQDEDVDAFMDDCTPFEYSKGKVKKLILKMQTSKFDQRVESGRMTKEERDEALAELEKEFEEEFGSEDSGFRRAGKGARESFREAIAEGKSAGLNWSKAKLEFVDASEFVTSDSPDVDKDDAPPKGFGQGDLTLVISEGGKRYKVELDDCLLIPGFGCLVGDGVRWRGEIE